jgi:hypothetical protein
MRSFSGAKPRPAPLPAKPSSYPPAGSATNPGRFVPQDSGTPEFETATPHRGIPRFGEIIDRHPPANKTPATGGRGAWTAPRPVPRPSPAGSAMPPAAGPWLGAFPARPVPALAQAARRNPGRPPIRRNRNPDPSKGRRKRTVRFRRPAALSPSPGPLRGPGAGGEVKRPGTLHDGWYWLEL